MKTYIGLIILFTIFFLFPINVLADEKPIVGAIRWDAWFGSATQFGDAHEKILNPSKWHYRIPFFGRIVSSDQVKFNGITQEIVDQNIAQAKNAGIDFWAFGVSDPSARSMDVLNYYLTSSHAGDVRFAIQTSADRCHIGYWGCPAEFPETQKFYFQLMAKPSYQKVLDGRPLIFVAYLRQTYIDAWGGTEGARAMIAKFREDAIAAGLGNPYLVLMEFSPNKAHQLQQDLGFDAISSYAITGGTSDGAPYSDLVQQAESVWGYQKNTGSQVIPVIQAGWDLRPNIDNPPYFNPPTADTVKHYQNPKPEQIADQLKRSLAWINSNPGSTQPKVAIISAWNDNGEGSWIEPTIYGGDARLEEIAKVVKGSYYTSSRFKGSDLNGDNKIDLFDYNLLVSNFGKAIDPIPLNADITGDGKVDIFDYNGLVANFGK